MNKLQKDILLNQVPVLVRFSQVTTGHGVPETEELSLTVVRLHRNDQIAQTFSPWELTEHKDFQLIPAREVLYVLVTLILSNDAIEFAAIKMQS